MSTQESDIWDAARETAREINDCAVCANEAKIPDECPAGGEMLHAHEGDACPICEQAWHGYDCDAGPDGEPITRYSAEDLAWFKSARIDI
jgi:hypothetical protein